MKSSLASEIVVSSALLAFMAPAWSAPLVLAMNELDPWKMWDANKQANGAYVEIVKELAKRTGNELKVVNCPLKRCLSLLETGEADVLIGVQESPERAAYLHFLKAPYRRYSSDKVFYVRRGEAAKIQKYADLAGKSIGTKIGANYFDKFDDDASLRKTPLVENEVNFQKLDAGRIDSVIIAEDQGEYLVSHLNLRDKIEKAKFREADGTPRSIALSKKSAHSSHLPEFEKAMVAMAQDGSLGRIYKTHFYQRFSIPETAVKIE